MYLKKVRNKIKNLTGNKGETEMVIGALVHPLLCPSGSGGGFYGVGVVDSGGGSHHRFRIEDPLGHKITGAPGEYRQFYWINCPPTFHLIHRSASPSNPPSTHPRQVLRTNTGMRTRSNTSCSNTTMIV